MNLPDAKVSQVCSNYVKAQRHHCHWVSSCYLGPQKEAVAERYCSGFSFQEPKEEKSVFQIAGDDRKDQALFYLWRGISTFISAPRAAHNKHVLAVWGLQAQGTGEISAALTPCWCFPTVSQGNALTGAMVAND